MLRTIAPADATLGMFVHAFEGRWIDHPFWRSKFLLSKPADVQKIRDSAISGLVIDVSRGADLPTTPVQGPAPIASLRALMSEPGLSIDFGPAARRAAQERNRRRRAPEPYRRPTPRRDAPPSGPCSVAEEAARAARIIDRASRAVIRTFDEARLGKAVQGRKLAPLVDQIAASVERNSSALLGLAQFKSAHNYTYMHSVAVCTMMVHLARHMGMDEEQARQAGMAGLLHDVGKMMVPVALLDKPGKLEDEEYALIKTHPVRGAELLRASSGLPDAVHDVCLHHHERLDGLGYPDGLSGDRISIFARMGAICDVYDAVTSDRAYKRAWSPAEALGRMREWEGHFDIEIFRCFAQSIGIYPVGKLVSLRSGRLGVVAGETPGAPLHPPVVIFRDGVAGIDLLPQQVASGEDEIIALERPEDWALTDWESRRPRLLATARA